MPIELSNAINPTHGFSFGSNGLNNIFANKIYTSAILTIFIIFLIMIIYPCKKNTPSHLLGKLAFYIFVTTLGVMFVHDCIVYNRHESKTEQRDSDEFVNNIGGNIAYEGSEDTMKVFPAENKIIDKTIGGDEMTGFGECSGITGGETNNTVGGDSNDLFNLYGV